MDKFTFYDKLTNGFANMQEAAVAKEKTKVGTWRGGSSGCITASGSIVGADPRQVVLRYLGVQTPVSYDTQLMFDAGLTNEDSFSQLLDLNGTEYKCEEEIPMKYNLPNGELVTGRPDIVLGNYDKIGEDGYLSTEFTPTLGVELKLICSPYSAHDKASWFKGNVDSKHLIQAAHYASFFKIPWVLAYTSRVNYFFPFYAIKDEEKHMINPEHRAVMRDEKTGKPFMIKPFQSFYDVTYEGDNLLLDGEVTNITASGITAFYEYCSDCIRNKEIPQIRSGNVDHWGKTNKKNKTLLYDPFKDADTRNGFDAWVASCMAIAEAL
jgi:hypothetical protein